MRMKKGIIAALVLCLAAVSFYAITVESTDAELEKVEAETVRYLEEEMGYEARDYTVIHTKYDYVLEERKAHVTKVSFYNEPREWYRYGLDESGAITQLDTSGGELHLES